MFLFYILLPVFIGAEEYGKFAYALAVASIIVQPTVEMGLDMVIVKWVSRGKVDVVRKAFLIRVGAAFVSIILLFIASLLLKIDMVVSITLYAYFVFMSFQNVTFSFYRGLEKMKLEGVINALQKVAALACLFLLSTWGVKSARLGSFALVGSAFLGILLLLSTSGVFIKEMGRYKQEADSLKYRELLKEGIVLGGVVFLWMIYFRIDGVMLGFMKGNLEVGIYNVGYKIMEGFFFIPGILMLVFFPKLAKPDRFAETFKKLIVILGTIGLLSSLILYVLSSSIIRFIYGPEFFGSIPVLKTLSLVLFPVFLGHLATQSLVALDMNKVYLFVAFIGMLLNISLNYFLIPSFGALGAAWATLITELMVVSCCGYFVWRKSPGVFNSLLLGVTAKS